MTAAKYSMVLNLSNGRMSYKYLGGIHGLRVSAIGLGCMGLSGAYESECNNEESMALIKESYVRGINFFDTADVYGNGHNEELISKALKNELKTHREDIVIATKGGFNAKDLSVNLSSAYILKACEQSLQRLGVSYIDLYYLHRTPRTLTELENSLDALAKLIQDGLIRYVGLSEASADSVRFAAAYFKKKNLIGKFIAVQSEFSLLTQNVMHNGVLDACNELGIGFIPYSPLSRALLAPIDKMHKDFVFADGDFRSVLPRFQGENFIANLSIRDKLEEIAYVKGCSISQLSLSWLMAQGQLIIPIPGTRKIKNLLDNLGSLAINFTHEELEQISLIVAPGASGTRYTEEMFAKQNITAQV